MMAKSKKSLVFVVDLTAVFCKGLLSELTLSSFRQFQKMAAEAAEKGVSRGIAIILKTKFDHF